MLLPFTSHRQGLICRIFCSIYWLVIRLILFQHLGLKLFISVLENWCFHIFKSGMQFLSTAIIAAVVGALVFVMAFAVAQLIAKLYLRAILHELYNDLLGMYFRCHPCCRCFSSAVTHEFSTMNIFFRSTILLVIYTFSSVVLLFYITLDAYTKFKIISPCCLT